MQKFYYFQIKNLMALNQCVQKMKGIDEDDYDLMDHNMEKLITMVEHWDDDSIDNLPPLEPGTSSQKPTTGVVARKSTIRAKSAGVPDKALSIASDDFEENVEEDEEMTNQTLSAIAASLAKRPNENDAEDNKNTEPRTKVSRNNPTYLDLQNASSNLEKETANETIVAAAFGDNEDDDSSRDNILYYTDSDSNSNDGSVSLLAHCPRLEDWNYIVHCEHTAFKCCGCGQTNPPGQACNSGLFSCPLETVYMHSCSRCQSL